MVLLGSVDAIRCCGRRRQVLLGHNGYFWMKECVRDCLCNCHGCWVLGAGVVGVASVLVGVGDVDESEMVRILTQKSHPDTGWTSKQKSKLRSLSDCH